jgi:uncharacterized protein YdbL (DUF1318 family)
VSRRLAAFLLLLLGCWSTAAPAQTGPGVTAARSAGFVGERFDGYLGARTAIPSATRRATEDVNIRRRALYSDLASRRGVSPQEVGVTAGCSLLARVAVGEWYLLGDNIWRQRQPGQPAPVPSYCTGG